MGRLLAAAIFLVYAGAALAAGVFPLFTTSSSFVPACPQGASLGDGCSGSPAGTVQLPHLLDLSSATQTYGSNYGARPSWNVAGVDYHVGVDTGDCPSFKNPSTLTANSTGVTQAGISWIAGGGTNSNVIVINGNNNTLDCYDFSDLHGGTGWVVEVLSGTGNTISNNKIVWPSGATTPQFPSTCNAFMDLVSIPYNEILSCSNVNTSTATNTVITKNYMDATNACNVSQGSCGVTLMEISGGGGATITYNQIQNVNGQLIAVGNSNAFSGWNATFKYNIMRNSGLYFGNTGAHGDIMQEFGTSSTINNLDIEYNLELQDASYAGGADTANGYSISSASANPGTVTGTTTFNSNIMIVPGVEADYGQNASVSGYIGNVTVIDIDAGRVVGPVIAENNWVDITGGTQNGSGGNIVIGTFSGGSLSASFLTWGLNFYLTTGVSAGHVSQFPQGVYVLNAYTIPAFPQVGTLDASGASESTYQSFTISATPTAGTTVGTVTVSNSASSFAIASGDPNGNFSITSGGVVKTTSAAHTNLTGSGSQTIVVTATNSLGTGVGQVTVNW